jgi:formate dehydrogenase iron-sulfur subunit
MWIAKGYKRMLRMDQLSAMGTLARWTLLGYLAVRIGDVAVRGQIANIGGWHGVSFVVEIAVLGLLPLMLLSVEKLRKNPNVLAFSAALVVLGVIWNRWNGVVYGMDLKGAMPQLGPLHYRPSLIEWGISVGMVAATIFLFKLGVAMFPILPKENVESVALGD